MNLVMLPTLWPPTCSSEMVLKWSE